MIEQSVDWERDVEDWLLWKQGYEFGPGALGNSVGPGGGVEVSVGLPILKAPRIPDTAGHPFRCEHFNGTLMGGECIRRQTHRNKATAQAKDQSPRVPLHLEYCASGKCEQGKEIRAKFPGWKAEERTRPVWTPPTDPLPADLAEDLAADPADAAQRVERDRVAAAVEEVRPEVAQRGEAARKDWEEFRARKEAARRAAPAEPVNAPEPHPLSARGMGSSPPKPPPICKADGCRTALRVNNLSGLCRLHRNKVTSRQREKLVPPVARAAGSAGNALGAKTLKEIKMNVCDCGKRIRTDRDGVLHKKCLACRRADGEASDGHRPPKKLRAVQQKKAAPPTPAQPVVYDGLTALRPTDSIESLLEQRRAHHLAEAERCGKALAALRGAA